MNPKLFGFRPGTQHRVRKLTGANDKEIPGWGRPIATSSSGTLWYTPSGGIPAATGTAPNLTPGVANCTKCEYWLDGSTVKIRAVSPTITEPVYNVVPKLIAGSKVIQAKDVMGKHTIDVEPCP